MPKQIAVYTGPLPLPREVAETLTVLTVPQDILDTFGFPGKKCLLLVSKEIADHINTHGERLPEA